MSAHARTLMVNRLIDLGHDPQASQETAPSDCEFQVSPTNETGFHSGRTRYRVECMTCSKLLHEATTGPMCRIEEHLKEKANQ